MSPSPCAGKVELNELSGARRPLLFPFLVIATVLLARVATRAADGYDPMGPIAPTSAQECQALRSAWDQRIRALDEQLKACETDANRRCQQSNGQGDVCKLGIYKCPCFSGGCATISQNCTSLAIEDSTAICNAGPAVDDCWNKVGAYRQQQADQQRQQEAHRQQIEAQEVRRQSIIQQAQQRDAAFAQQQSQLFQQQRQAMLAQQQQQATRAVQLQQLQAASNQQMMAALAPGPQRQPGESSEEPPEQRTEGVNAPGVREALRVDNPFSGSAAPTVPGLETEGTSQKDGSGGGNEMIASLDQLTGENGQPDQVAESARLPASRSARDDPDEYFTSPEPQKRWPEEERRAYQDFNQKLIEGDSWKAVVDKWAHEGRQADGPAFEAAPSDAAGDGSGSSDDDDLHEQLDRHGTAADAVEKGGDIVGSKMASSVGKKVGNTYDGALLVEDMRQCAKSGFDADCKDTFFTDLFKMAVAEHPVGEVATAYLDDSVGGKMAPDPGEVRGDMSKEQKQLAQKLWLQHQMQPWVIDRKVQRLFDQMWNTGWRPSSGTTQASDQ